MAQVTINMAPLRGLGRADGDCVRRGSHCRFSLRDRQREKGAIPAFNRACDGCMLIRAPKTRIDPSPSPLPFRRGEGDGGTCSDALPMSNTSVDAFFSP